MKNVSVKLINFYRSLHFSNLGYVFFGPSFGCKFYPTCSHYAEQSVNKYGTIKGTIKSFRRVLKCNPFSKGGVDLP